MKRYKTISITILSIVIIVACLKFWAVRAAIKLDGPIWNSIEKCAENQKQLYQSLEYYIDENGHLPDHIDDFKINDFPATMVWKCPATQGGYVVFLENYGNPKTVLIADKENKHPTTFMLWFRGITPYVQTMGDGTI